MRRYLSLFAVLVTLALYGCAGGTATSTDAMRTPSGSQISDRLPDFQPVTEGQSAPLVTAQNGRASVSPYFQKGKSAPHELPPVKVGFLVPLSGPQGTLGQSMLNAAQMALFDMGTSNITLVPRDTAKGASQAAEEALGEGAQIILGPLFANDVKAVSPVARARNVPVIAFSTDWTAANDNTYIMGFLPFGQVARVVDFTAKRGAKQFAAIIPETPYGMVVNGSLKNELERQGLSAPKSAIFNNNAGLNQAVKSLAATQQPGSMVALDAVMIPLGGTQLTQAATTLRQHDMGLRQTRIIGTGLWDDSMPAAQLLPGAWYAAPDPNARTAFNTQYRQTYGANAPRLATLAYDATALAAALAVKGLNETGQPSYDRASLTNPSGFAGLDGVFRFRPDGLAERGLAILELRPTGPVVIDPAPTRF